MNIPTIGELNHRIKIFVRTHEPNGRFGFEPAAVDAFEVWGKLEVVGGGTYWGSKQVDDTVTHRIWVRRIRGKTEPKMLRGVTELEADDRRFRAKRVEDADGLHRFTVIECEELGESHGDG